LVVASKLTSKDGFVVNGIYIKCGKTWSRSIEEDDQNSAEGGIE
jgi:hypothetical protein